jgi:two-component system, response regulator YesN
MEELSMYKLLVVDDQKIIRDGFIRMLQRDSRNKYQIYQADCGQEALKTALEVEPQIVVTDVKMPDYSGLELIRRLKTRLKGSKYVIISGYDNFSYAKEAIRLEVSDYLLKPINRADVAEVMDKLTSSLDSLDTEANAVSEMVGLNNDDLNKPSGEKLSIGVDNTGNSSAQQKMIVEYAMDYVNKNFDKNLSLTYISNLVSRNYSYFSNLFSTETGSNFCDYLRNVRIEKAKELLRDMRYMVNDISRKVGYQDTVQFSKAFRKHTGMTPGQYRSQYAKKTQ